MSTLRSSLVRLAYENPDLQPHLLPLLQDTDRTAGFFDFLRRHKPPAPPKGGLLASALQPDNPRGPLGTFLQRVQAKSRGQITDISAFDWNVENDGDTLSVKVYMERPQPEMMYADGDLESPNWSWEMNRQLGPFLRELEGMLGADVKGNARYFDQAGITRDIYELTISLPPGTVRSQYAPSPLRVASRYLARR
jgi:hypothetical protein